MRTMKIFTRPSQLTGARKGALRAVIRWELIPLIIWVVLWVVLGYFVLPEKWYRVGSFLFLIYLGVTHLVLLFTHYPRISL